MKRLEDSTKLFLVKLAHTAIWYVFTAAILYTFYAGVFDRVDRLVWYCIGLVFLEGVILVICRWRCPLTLLGEKYTDDTRIGFDIFLPAWLAKHNKTIFSILSFVGFALVLWRVL